MYNWKVKVIDGNEADYIDRIFDNFEDALYNYLIASSAYSEPLWTISLIRIEKVQE